MSERLNALQHFLLKLITVNGYQKAVLGPLHYRSR